MGRRESLIGLGAALIGACSAPAAKPAPAPVHAAPSTTATASDSAVAPAPKGVPRSWQELSASLAHAYGLRAAGDEAGARAAFEEILVSLVAGGAKETAGLGDVEGDVVRGRTKAGFSVREQKKRGTWFFDIESGEPFAFAPGMALRRGAPPLDEPQFVAETGEGMSLYDPVKASFASLPGSVVALHPDGHRVYLLGEDCRLREWSFAKAAVSRELDAHYQMSSSAESGSRMECSPYGFRDAAVTANGKWLTTRYGRWDLDTGKRRKLPFRWDADDYAPAVSPDGRYVARIAPKSPAPKDPLAQAWVLVLHDLDSGTTRTSTDSTGFLSNGDPLSFGVSPARVCIFDYGIQAFEVPSLRRFQPGDSALLPEQKPASFGPNGCETRFVRPPPDHPELVARLAARVCEVGGLLFPAEHCTDSGR